MKTKAPDSQTESTMQSSLTLNLPTHQERRFKAGIWLLLLLGFANAGRATDVAGTIIGEHWTKANSPYRVVGDILAADLTIDPGVSIYFVSNYVFEVAANVTAIGTPADPILFTSTNGAVGWQGIFFNASGEDSTLAYCWIQNSVKSGIRVSDSSPVIRNCIITNNTTIGNGGGVWVQNSTYDLLLQDCTIINNRSKGDNTGRMGMGGGIAAFMGQGVLRLSGTTVSGNATVPDPGTPYGNDTRLPGGGLYIVGNALLESNCNVSYNAAVGGGGSTFPFDSVGAGGGLFCSGGTAVLRNTLIASNTAVVGPAGHLYTYGAGLYLDSGQLCVTNSIIADNSGNALPASAVYVNSGQANLVNCAIAYNGTEGLNVAGGSALVLNSIFFNNNYYTGLGYLDQIIGTTNVSYCDIQNGYAGMSNINFSPIFRSRTDLMIVRPSKCIDAGSTNAIYTDVSFPPSLGALRNDIGAHGGPGAAGWYSAPMILWPPANQYAVTNTPVCISAGAAGAYPLSYQWYRGTNLLTGQTDSSLCFSSVQLSDQGSYSVVVTNLYGAVSSPPVTLSVTTNGAAILDIHMYAGVNILGLPGRTYTVSYTTDVGPSPTWTPLATNTMAVPNWFFLDMDSPVPAAEVLPGGVEVVRRT